MLVANIAINLYQEGTSTAAPLGGRKRKATASHDQNGVYAGHSSRNSGNPSPNDELEQRSDGDRVEDQQLQDMAHVSLSAIY